MKKLNDIELEFYDNVMEKLKSSQMTYEVNGSDLRIFLDDKHTILMEYNSKREIILSLNKYGIWYLLFGGYTKKEIETLKSIKIHKWMNKKIFNELDTFIKENIKSFKVNEHIKMQNNIKEILKND